MSLNCTRECSLYLQPKLLSTVAHSCFKSFNFVYRQIQDSQGSTVRIPELEIRDGLRGLSIGKLGNGTGNDNADSADNGAVELTSTPTVVIPDPEQRAQWTFSRVREQVQHLVRTSVANLFLSSPHGCSVVSKHFRLTLMSRYVRSTF